MLKYSRKKYIIDFNKILQIFWSNVGIKMEPRSFLIHFVKSLTGQKFSRRALERIAQKCQCVCVLVSKSFGLQTVIKPEWKLRCLVCEKLAFAPDKLFCKTTKKIRLKHYKSLKLSRANGKRGTGQGRFQPSRTFARERDGGIPKRRKRHFVMFLFSFTLLNAFDEWWMWSAKTATCGGFVASNGFKDGDINWIRKKTHFWLKSHVTA